MSPPKKKKCQTYFARTYGLKKTASEAMAKVEAKLTRRISAQMAPRYGAVLTGKMDERRAMHPDHRLRAYFANLPQCWGKAF